MRTCAAPAGLLLASVAGLSGCIPSASLRPVTATATATQTPRTPNGPPVGPNVGNSGADFSLFDLSANGHSLSGYRGKVVLLVAFDGNDCAACSAVLPDIENDIWPVYRYQGVGLQALAAGGGTGAAQLQANLSAAGLAATFPVLADPDWVVWLGYSLPGELMPLLVVLDRDGVIRYRRMAAASYDHDGVVNAIVPLL